MPRGMLAAFSRAVQLAQAAAEGLDLLLVPDLLPLSQFESFEHSIHVVQRGAKRLDDVIDLLDSLLNGHWTARLRLAHWRWGKFPRFATWRSLRLALLAPRRRGILAWFARWRLGSLVQLGRQRRGGLRLGWEGLCRGLNRLGGCFRRGRLLLDGRSGSPPPATSMPAPAASAAARRAG